MSQKTGKHLDLAQIAKERIYYLLSLAAEKWVSQPEFSRRYVALARKIAMRHRIRLGNKLFCKKCNAVFIHGKTVKSRLVTGKVKWTCIQCSGSRTIARANPKKPANPTKN